MRKNTKEPTKFKIKVPRAGFRILLYLCAIFFSALSIYEIAINHWSESALIACYSIGAISLICAAYCLVFDIRRLFGFINKIIRRHHFTRRLADEYRYRTLIFLIPGMVANILFAMLNAYSGAAYHSAWFGTLAAYYILLCIMRIICLVTGQKLRNENNSKLRREKEYQIYIFCSALLLIMGIVQVGMTVLLYHSQGIKEYSGTLIYAVALYTFIRVFLSIRGLFTAGRTKSPLLVIIRKIGQVDACVAVLTLQIGMFYSFAGAMEADFVREMNVATSAVVCLITIAIGLQGVIKGRKELRR